MGFCSSPFLFVLHLMTPSDMSAEAGKSCLRGLTQKDLHALSLFVLFIPDRNYEVEEKSSPLSSQEHFQLMELVLLLWKSLFPLHTPEFSNGVPMKC